MEMRRNLSKANNRIDIVQQQLQKGLDRGLTKDQLFESLYKYERKMIDLLIVTNSCKSMVACAKVFKKTPKDMAAILDRIKLKLMKTLRETLPNKYKCSHQTSRGKLLIYPINEDGDFRCSDCGTDINMRVIGNEKLMNAVNTVYSAIQQMKTKLREINEFENVEHLGLISFNLKETEELYNRIINNLYSRRRDNRKKDTYGGSISFRGPRRNRI